MTDTAEIVRSVDAVVFDIGRVLLGWDPDGHYDRLVGPARRAEFFAETGMLAVNDAIDAGTPFEGALDELIGRHPGWRDEIEIWRRDWHLMIGPPIPWSVQLLEELRSKGVPCHALTNFGDETWDRARAMFPFLEDFDRVFVSARLKLVKPDPAIYEVVERDLGLPPGALLFTDDKPENVEAAAARGWQTHLFDGPEGFAQRLVDEGLLSVAEAAET